MLNNIWHPLVLTSNSKYLNQPQWVLVKQWWWKTHSNQLSNVLILTTVESWLMWEWNHTHYLSNRSMKRWIANRNGISAQFQHLTLIEFSWIFTWMWISNTEYWMLKVLGFKSVRISFGTESGELLFIWYSTRSARHSRYFVIFINAKISFRLKCWPSVFCAHSRFCFKSSPLFLSLFQTNKRKTISKTFEIKTMSEYNSPTAFFFNCNQRYFPNCLRI